MRSAPLAVPVAARVPATRQTLSAGLAAVSSGLAVGAVTGLLSWWSVVVAGAGYLLGAALIAGSWRAPRFGAANTITLSRLVGGCWVVALTVQAALAGLSTPERLLLVGLATVCLLLDGVDGWVARRRGEISDFGARFDVETDALLLLCLSVVVPILGVAGWWVVLLSGLRWGYVLASRFLPVLRVPVGPTYFGKVACVYAQAALIAALVLDLAAPAPATGLLISGLLVSGLALLVISFARHIRRQVRHDQGERIAA